MLTVTAAVVGRSVNYTIQASEPLTDRTGVKTARFSELHNLHKSLAAEVPSFPGVFPSKTWGRKTSAAFVESRRKDLELYLRLVATHHAAKESISWVAFIGNSEVNTDPNEVTTISEDADDFGEDLEGGCTWSNENFQSKLCSKVGESFKSEVGTILSTKKGELSSAKDAKQELEESMACNEEVAQAGEADAKERAALEAEAAGLLRRHQLSLEELEAKIATKKSLWSDKSLRQNELAKRFEEKLALVSESVKEAEARLESSQRACDDAIAKSSSQVAAAMANQVEAETANSASTEVHAAMKAALDMLQVTAKAHSDEFKAAERELDILKSSEKVLVTESSQAATLRCNAESEAKAAVAAASSFSNDAARRCHAGEVEIRRAQERSADLAALRDMQTRGLLTADDRSSCKRAEDAAVGSAEAASKALAKATQRHEETKAKDAQESVSLQAAAAKATQTLRNREAAAAAYASRVEVTKAQLQKASTKCTLLGAAHQAVDKELQDLKQRVAVIAEPLAQCAIRLEEAKTHADSLKRDSEKEQAALHHAVRADTQLLTGLRAEEASLKHALDESHKFVAEARDAAVVPSEDTEAEDARAKVDLLVQKSAARCFDRQVQAKEAADAYKAAAAAAEAARAELEDSAGLDESVDSLEAADENNVKYAKLRAKLERQVKRLEVVVQEKKKASEVEAAALAAVKQELSEMQAQQKATPTPIHPIERLMREELAVVKAELQHRETKESDFRAEAEQKKADWMKLKVDMSADLHILELEYDMAKLNASATKDLALSLLGA
jgi:hypothetical protein